MFNVKRKVQKIPNALVRFVVCMIPRKKHLIIYGGAMDTFIDNTKYMFIYNNLYLQNYRHVWLTKNEVTLDVVKKTGFEVCMSNSFRGVFLQLCAGFYIFDENINHFANHNLSAGSCRINLWHGIPFKMIGWIRSDDDPPYQIRSWLREKYFADHIHGDYMLSTSKQFVRMFSAALLFCEENIYVSGYPRTLPLIVSDCERERYIAKYETTAMQQYYERIKHDQRRKIIYMPTFRDKNPNYISHAIPDWEDLNTALKESNVTLYVKVHRMTPTPNDNCFSNIVIMEASLDVYPLLPLFDCLVTDVSSIIIDYTLLHKPIYLYTFDIDEYIRDSRPVFKRFWDIHRKLKIVNDYESFKRLLVMSQLPESMLSIDEFFDCPYDMDATLCLIQKLS